MLSDRKRIRAEMAFAIIFVLVVMVLAAASLFQESGRKMLHGGITIPSPAGGIYLVVNEESVSYRDYGEIIIPANADYLLELETSAADGEYLAYGIDGEYRADVLASGGRITLLLNLGRGRHELMVYVPYSGKYVIEKYAVAAV